MINNFNINLQTNQINLSLLKIKQLNNSNKN